MEELEKIPPHSPTCKVCHGQCWKEDMEQEDRLYKRPKYKIGDIVVYIRDNGNEDSTELMQEIVTGADALVETWDKNDTLTWYYTTKESLIEDALTEDNILYKLND